MKSVLSYRGVRVFPVPIKGHEGAAVLNEYIKNVLYSNQQPDMDAILIYIYVGYSEIASCPSILGKITVSQAASADDILNEVECWYLQNVNCFLDVKYLGIGIGEAASDENSAA